MNSDLEYPTNVTKNTTATDHLLQGSRLSYLITGLALMMGLVAFALILLACSLRETYSNSSSSTSSSSSEESNARGEKIERPVQEDLRLEMEPKIVVIMAGDRVPTFLAEPMASNDGTCIDDASKIIYTNS